MGLVFLITLDTFFSLHRSLDLTEDNVIEEFRHWVRIRLRSLGFLHCIRVTLVNRDFFGWKNKPFRTLVSHDNFVSDKRYERYYEITGN